MAGASAASSTRPSRFREVMLRLRGRPDSEHEMSFNRVAMMIATFVYVAVGDSQPNGILALIGYGVASVAALIHILYDPAARVWRRLLMMVVDHGGLSYFLYVNGEYAAGLWPLYLWTIFGYGFRFGNRYLFASVATAVLFFSAVIAISPFWSAHLGLSIGLVIGLVILPAYASQLIKKLSKAKFAAEEASRAKSHFLASVSHELRTPLTAIIGLGAHMRDSDLPPDQRNMAATVVTAGRSLLSLINQLLDFARLGAKGIVSEAKTFDLLPMLGSVRDLFRMSAEEKSLRLSIHVSARTPLRILGDEPHMRDVLVNLLGNAIKFTDSGSVTISADVERLQDGSLKLILAVADTGIGIEPEAQKHIFESFRQADDTIIDRFGGTGLGLAISQQVAMLLGGEIGVTSVPGAGSRFWFSAKVADAENAGQGGDSAAGQFVLFSSDEQTIAAMRTAAEMAGLSIDARPGLAEVRGLALDPSRGQPCAVLIDERECIAQAMSAEDARAALGPGIAPILVCAPERGFDEAEAERNFVSALTANATAGELTRAFSVACAAGAPAGREEEEAEDAVPSRPLRILVADDNAMNQKVFSMILGRAGHGIEVAEHGEAALDAMKDHGLDIVLMDVNMPVLNGIEATKLYRFTALGRKRIPIIGITADASPATAERCLEAGMDACISKPIEAAPLLRLIASLTDDADKPVVPSFDPSGVIVPLFRQEDDTGSPAINAGKLAELEELGGTDFVQDLLAQYVSDAESLLAMIRRSVVEDDIDAFRNGTHALRSSGGNIGADVVSELCLHLQRIERAEFDARGEAHVAHLEAELQRVRDALVRHRHAPATAARK